MSKDDYRAMNGEIPPTVITATAVPVYASPAGTMSPYQPYVQQELPPQPPQVRQFTQSLCGVGDIGYCLYR